MAVYTEAIQKLYVAYFARPADFGGLNFWETYLEGGGNINTIAAEFAKSDEYKAAYGNKDAYNVVATVYQNLFGRMPDVDGLNFWAQGLMKGTFTVDVAVTTIAAGAQGSDAVALNNKVAAATAFTTHLNTAAEILAYSGDAANLVAKNFIATVTDDASLAAAVADANINSIVSTIVENGPSSGGQQYVLTAGQDVIVGTSGNDFITVNAFNATTGAEATNMSTIDSIDGGAGKDTLNVQIAVNAAGDKNLNGTLPSSIKNVEIINLNQTDANATLLTTLDASKFVGATNINQIGHAVAVTKLGASTTAGFDSITGEDIVVTAAGATASISMNAVDETSQINVDGSKLANVVVSGNRADTDSSDDLDTLVLNVKAGTDVQSIKVTTNQVTELLIDDSGSAAGKQVTSVDASASTASVTYVGDADALTIATGSGGDFVTFAGVTAAASGSVAAVNGSVSTGAGNDSITVGNIAASTGGTVSVDAGAGNDIVDVTKTNGVTLNVQGGAGNDSVTLTGSLATTDVINGGDGTDTIAMAGAATRTADDYIVFNKLVTGFETIKFTGAAEAALDASKLAANYTTIDLYAGSAVTKVGSQAVIAHGALTISASGYSASTTPHTYAGTLNVTEKAAGTVTANADTVNLTVKAAAAGVAAGLTGDFKTGVVTLVNSVDDANDPTADTIASVTIDSGTAAAMSSLTLTGNGSASVTSVDTGKLTMIDASGLGGTYTVGANEGTAISGLTLLSSETSAETIKLGAGIDNITLNASTYAAVDSVQGLNLVWNTAHDDLTTTSDALTVGGVVAASLVKFTTTQTDIDLALKDVITAGKTDAAFVINGDTYVFHDGGVAGTLESGDVLVKLVGITDVNAVILALGGTLV